MSVSPLTFCTLDQAAFRLNLPRSWFRREVEAGRIPYIALGNRRMFDLEAVHRALIARAQPVEVRAEK